MGKEKVLEMVDVSKSFWTINGELDVIDGIDIELHEGEIVGIIGPSGSGKTTILNLIAGLLAPTKGKVTLKGEVGYMFQKDHLLEWRNIWKNVTLGLEIKKQKTTENLEKVKNMLVKYGLIDFINNYPKELSGGMRQRIALIRTLATSPQLLLLDEPFSALDFQTRLMVCDDVYKMIKTEKIATILVTHDISEAISMCDRIIVLSKRPAHIINSHTILFNDLKNKAPLKTRSEEIFQNYFDEIWKELNENEPDEA